MSLPQTEPEMRELIDGLREMARQAQSENEVRSVTSKIASITRQYRIRNGIGIPATLLGQAQELDPGFRDRPHLRYLSDRLANAVRDVERGKNRILAVSMPPRAGKSTMLSLYGPLWLLRRHPEWDIVTSSHDGSLTAGWARSTRRLIEDHPSLGIALERDGGAGSHWKTVEGGGVFSVSVRGPLTGRGARVLVIDDPVKDFVDAHSASARQTLWDWWLSVAFNRLEAPYLVLVVMTRWHEDDFVGRLLSPEHEGDPRKVERISLPAIATDENDPLGRQIGQPLYSPLAEETEEEAIARWEDIRRSVGTYTFSAMHQQRPSPAKGAIFDSGWWRFWTMDPDKETEDGKVVYLDPAAQVSGDWLDSWDASFKSTGAGGGWVVGQRWVRVGANRYLISQQRGRWSFTQTIAKMQQWAEAQDPVNSPCGHLVHSRLIEERANGAAIIDVLKEKISGLKPINPTISKEARARAVTPEIESGNVFLPHPSDPGNEWLADFLSEMRNFPNDAHDDQVDSLTQGLTGLRIPGQGIATVPGNMVRNGSRWQVSRDIARAAASDITRRSYR